MKVCMGKNGNQHYSCNFDSFAITKLGCYVIVDVGGN